jgi:hypothetical protein
MNAYDNAWGQVQVLIIFGRINTTYSQPLSQMILVGMSLVALTPRWS